MEKAVHKPFQCNICNKRFSRTRHLQDHKVTHRHDNERPWACGECSKTFRQKRYLNRHVKRSHREKEAPLPASEPAVTEKDYVELKKTIQ